MNQLQSFLLQQIIIFLQSYVVSLFSWKKLYVTIYGYKGVFRDEVHPDDSQYCI